MSEFNLQKIQNEMLGVADSLIVQENVIDKVRDVKQRSIRKIVDLYKSSRSNNKVFKSTYDALKDQDPWTRMAAVDLISQYGNSNSFEYLFKALEDEDRSNIKQKIAKSIDKLEARLNNLEDVNSVSIIDAAKVLSYSK